MSIKSCTAVRRRLSAFHDGELNIDERVAVQTHLQDCERCAGDAQAVRDLGEALRAAAAARIEAVDEDLAGLSASVVSRQSAERSESLGGRFGRLFEDLHVVWAALGATGAAVACVAIIVGLYFAIPKSPESLAAVFAALSSPGSNENPVSIDPLMALPSTSADDPLWNKVSDADTEEDLVLLMDVLVSKEGKVRDVKLVNPTSQSVGAETAARREAIRALSDAILNARLQPARNMSGIPLAVKVVWLHAHLTVRAKLPADLRPPGRALSLLLPAEPSPLVSA
jgi:hypothetical protein